MVILATTMRQSVRATWPAMCKQYEGRLATMYLDTKGLVTTGTGNLIDSVAAAQALPWWTKDGILATAKQVETEWRQIKARQASKSLGGYAFVKWATLHLSDDTIDTLLFSVTDKFWTALSKTLPQIAGFPADAQLALLDLSWQNGPAFLDPGTVWTGTRAAVLAQDWKAAASHVPGTGSRADRRRRLFANAAAVVALKLDPEVLWDAKTPTGPVAPTPPPVVTPTPAPVVKYAPRHGAALAQYARSKVDTTYGIGWCQKFTNECGQTGSVGDYDNDGAADAEDGWKKAMAKGKVVKVADITDYDAIPEGVYHYWLGGSSDHGHACVGVGGRQIVSTDMTDKGPRYGKVGLCDIGSPSKFWSVKYAGYALIEGNGYTLTDPPVVPVTPTPVTPAKPVEDGYPTPTSKVVYVSKLNPGQKASDSVWWVQKALGVALTGNYDAATVAAVKAFQKGLGDDVDGDLGPLETVALFTAHPTLGVTVKDKP